MDMKAAKGIAEKVNWIDHCEKRIQMIDGLLERCPNVIIGVDIESNITSHKTKLDSLDLHIMRSAYETQIEQFKTLLKSIESI